MTTAVIQARDLGKRYFIGERQEAPDMASLLKTPFRRLNSLLRRQMPVFAEKSFWAMRHLDFEVYPGEVLGIIGHNGAGKSTLLKILAGISDPTEGEATLQGRIGSLLEVGTGFHGELTGRENIYLNGAILGMRRHEISAKFDEIVQFAGVEAFIDTPIKRYSSGMKVRLGFAVAAHLEPEILLIDEVLAVGDAAFQEKCLGKMNEVVHSGRTILFVSHNMSAMNSLCNRVIWLEQGQIAGQGDTASVVQRYLEKSLYQQEVPTQPGYIPLTHRTDRKGDGILRFTHIRLLNEQGEPVAICQSGSTLRVALGYQTTAALANSHATVIMTLLNRQQQFITTLRNTISGDVFPNLTAPVGEFICEIPQLPLMPGQYVLNISCLLNSAVTDGLKYAAEIRVMEGNFYPTKLLPERGYGDVLFHYNWHVEEGETP